MLAVLAPTLPCTKLMELPTSMQLEQLQSKVNEEFAHFLFAIYFFSSYPPYVLAQYMFVFWGITCTHLSFKLTTATARTFPARWDKLHGSNYAIRLKTNLKKKLYN